MSFAQAKEIALLRLALRAAWDAGDRAAARVALERFTALVSAAGNENELVAETRRWSIKLG